MDAIEVNVVPVRADKWRKRKKLYYLCHIFAIEVDVPSEVHPVIVEFPQPDEPLEPGELVNIQ
jgi:hypothetical protein